MISEILIFLVIAISSYLFFFKNKSKNEGNFNEIPLIEGLPLVGSVGDFFCSDEKLWKKMRQRSLELYPIYRQKKLSTELVFVLDPEDVEVVFDRKVSTSKGILNETLRKFLGNGLITSEGDSWKRRRRLLSKCMNFSILQKFVPIFSENVKSFTEKSQSTPIDVQTQVKFLTSRNLNDTMIGQKVDETLLKNFTYALDFMMRIVCYRSELPFFDFFTRFTNLPKKEHEAMKVFDKYSSVLFEKHRDVSKQDTKEEYENMINHMANASELFEDDESIKNELKTFAFAGHDTVASAVSFTLMSLASYPELQEKLYQEIIDVLGHFEKPNYALLKSMDYLDRYIKESLRHYPPGVWIARKIEETFTTKTGFTITAGKTVIVYIYDIHHNPKLYPKPYKFDPDRFLPENIQKRHPYSYIPFGCGPRNCIAQKYAFLEVKTTICTILQRFIVKTDKHIEDYSFIANVILQTRETMKVKLIPRN